MKIIAIEEHWNSAGIREALDRLPDGARDDSIAFNTMGDNQARLQDIGQDRIEAAEMPNPDDYGRPSSGHTPCSCASLALHAKT
jgi:hypothetical protein